MAALGSWVLVTVLLTLSSPVSVSTDPLTDLDIFAMQVRRRAWLASEADPLTASQSGQFPTCEECQAVLLNMKSLLMSISDTETRQGVVLEACHQLLPPYGYNASIFCPELILHHFRLVVEMASGGHSEAGVCRVVGLCPGEPFPPSDSSALDSSMARLVDRVSQGRAKVDLDQRPARERRSTDKPLTFVQLSDIHLDPKYLVGGPTECIGPICCRRTLLNIIFGSGSAGRFGDYHCDAVNETVSAMLDYIQGITPKPDFFIYVGDNSPHVILETMPEKISENQDTYRLLGQKLRSMGPIYPAMGNHETFPQSFYWRECESAQAILQLFSEEWPKLFPATPDQVATIREHAYYTALVKPRLRILTFNIMYSYLLNIFALKSDKDTVKKKQYDFVIDTLTEARRMGEKVIFVAHMKPSFDNTYTEYAEFMNMINTKFSDVIILQLSGHEHLDLFLLNKDPKDSTKTTGVSLAAPCMTPYLATRTGTNPSFRVFKLDPDAFTPLDYDQYYVDLVGANADGQVTVKKQYTFTTEYGVPDLSINSFDNLANRIHSSYRDFQTYESNFYVRATSEYSPCAREDIECRREITCRTRTSTLRDYVRCVKIRP